MTGMGRSGRRSSRRFRRSARAGRSASSARGSGRPPGELERVARGAEPWAVKSVGRDVEAAMGMEPSGEPGPFIDPDARASAFAMSTSEWLAMVHGKRPDKAEAHETDPDSPTYDRLPGRWAWLARLCDEAYGLPRHLSQHPGGMLVSTRPPI